MTEREKRLPIALAVMRLSIGAFFLVWSLEKLLAPEIARRVFGTFYFTELPAVVSYAIGAGQTVIVLAFLAGAFRTWTYGALLAMHSVSVLSTWQRLADPYEPPNHLFWAGVPVLAALVALFMLRDADRMLSVGGPVQPRKAAEPDWPARRTP